ncbi:alpha-E domain-containing protein [Croceiramulus getboli]|nr:alpha-E domain-containing protein [Flavobacteriaceae bacterium YJPT1-3]
MLARVANNLFWMGRYIERAEHTARYLSVNYFSSLDAPHDLSQSRQFVLRSMYYFVGDPVQDPNSQLDEEETLFHLGLDPNHFYSILSSIKYARENANGARDLISTELYEALNRFYHFVLNYSKEDFVKKGLFDFTLQVTEMTAVLRAKIRGTLLHDEVYAIIMLGVNIERATQIIRMVNAKYNDARVSEEQYGDQMTQSFEWITLLKCAESYDMMRRLYKKTPTQNSTLEFLILNPDCPRSVMNSLNQVHRHMQILNREEQCAKDSAKFLIGKVRAEYQFKLIEEIEGGVQNFIEDILNKLVKISDHLEKEYFYH